MGGGNWGWGTPVTSPEPWEWNAQGPTNRPTGDIPPQNRIVKVFDNLRTPEIAIDCEMVEARNERSGRRYSVLARVSIVNTNCEPLLDTYVDPEEWVTDYRTPYSGILPEHLENAPVYHSVRNCVVDIVSGRTIIGHDLKQDLSVLNIKNLTCIEMRDTCWCYMSYFKPNEKPSLKRLAKAVLNETIQIGPHDSMEDAKTAMKLYNHWKLLGRNIQDAIPIEKTKYKRNNQNHSNDQHQHYNYSNGNNSQDNNYNLGHNQSSRQIQYSATLNDGYLNSSSDRYYHSGYVQPAQGASNGSVYNDQQSMRSNHTQMMEPSASSSSSYINNNNPGRFHRSGPNTMTNTHIKQPDYENRNTNNNRHNYRNGIGRGSRGA